MIEREFAGWEMLSAILALVAISGEDIATIES
jgi:hypothetical protein